ncbi:hypothetical protein GR268_47995 [Rhizobium leguminosarum]|nr:hypothetical protein [Rhizobium leguminosarum]
MLNTGNFMSMNSRFKDVCDTILKYRDHKERIIRRTVINLLPRLAAFAPEEVRTNSSRAFFIFFNLSNHLALLFY